MHAALCPHIARADTCGFLSPSLSILFSLSLSLSLFLSLSLWGQRVRVRVHSTENTHTRQVNADIHDAGVHGFGMGLCGGPLESLA